MAFVLALARTEVDVEGDPLENVIEVTVTVKVKQLITNEQYFTIVWPSSPLV